MTSIKATSQPFRINWEKQESLVKLGILVLAAILCKTQHFIMEYSLTVVSFQPSQLAYSVFCALKVSFMSLIRILTIELQSI